MHKDTFLTLSHFWFALAFQFCFINSKNIFKSKIYVFTEDEQIDQMRLKPAPMATSKKVGFAPVKKWNLGQKSGKAAQSEKIHFSQFR